MKKRRALKTLVIATVMAFAATACSGAVEVEPTAAVPQSVPTTAPVSLPEADQLVVDEPITSDNIQLTSLQENPWLVDVLHVKDDTTIIPTFDGPFGAPTTLHDINAVDGITQEYPLTADTAHNNRLALLVEEFDATGAWAKVQVPVRPNGTTTWVQTAFFTQESHDYHITIDLSENLVSVYKGEDLIIEQIAVMGRETRPTPTLRTYIDEKIPGASISPAYGDWILSFAAYSEVLGSFNANLPKLALHGTDQPELVGQYLSSGCVRIPNEVVSFIAEAVPLGAIVDIVE